MTYTYRDVPENKIIWCCAYDTDNNKETMALKCLPRKCIVSRRRCKYIGKDDKPLQQSVQVQHRQYADTYKECCGLYNDLVQKRYDFLGNLQDEVYKDFLKDDKGEVRYGYNQNEKKLILKNYHVYR